jgi:hypothetical protein
MKIVFASLLALSIYASTAQAALTPSHLWSESWGGSNTDQPNAVAVDAAGNIYVAGQFTETSNFGGSDLVSAGILEFDIFVAKYNSAGVHQWSYRYGSTTSDAALGIAVDPNGNVYVCGEFRGTVNFGGVADLVSNGVDDIFLVKFNTNGNWLWQRSAGGANADAAYSVAASSSAVVITGYFTGTINFGGTDLISAGSQDCFVARYTNLGTHVFSKGFGGTSSDQAHAVVLDSGGNAIITGYFANTINFGGSNLVSAGGVDIFLAKFNSTGTHVWSSRFGSTSTEQGEGLAVDASNNVILTGLFSGTINFGGANLVPVSQDAFLAKFNSSAVHQWSQRMGGTGLDRGDNLAVDSDGNILLGGNFTSTANFGGNNLVSAGGTDIALARYNSSGVHQWSDSYGGSGNDAPGGIAADATGAAVFTGMFIGGVNFGGTTLQVHGFGTAADMVLAKYGVDPSEPIISSVVDLPNDQGRSVKVTFSYSGEDDPRAAFNVTHYEAYRRSDPAPAQVTGASRRQLLDSGWTEVGTVDAHGTKTYSIDVPTIGDSTQALGQYYSVFKIRAATTSNYIFHDSPPDSGYSADNLAPGIPGSFVFSAGQLTWKESTADDFDYFTVYGANTTSFGSATLVNYTTNVAMNVSGSPHVYYFVTATDFSGNEGKPAIVNSLSGVGGTPASYVLSVSNYPNPFNPRTTVKYTVPSRGHVRIDVYDASGAHVRTLFNGERNAGAYATDWDGLAENRSAVGSGIYFARITHHGATQTKKMALLK